MSSQILTMIKGLDLSPINSKPELPVDENADALKLEQSVYYVATDKKLLLLKQIINERSISNAIIFVRTSYAADQLSRNLSSSGITVEAFHGNKPMNAQLQTLANLRNSRVHILVVTDTAASGIGISDFDFVINYELPDSAETYAQRLANTTRSGHVLSLCDPAEVSHLKNINRVSLQDLQVIAHPFG
jgi:ATP-dependent RNA helicase RhlE